MTTRQDYSDLSSGFVLHSSPGYPAFPVRLAQEMFLRASAHLHKRIFTLWDPCCGSGYLATTLGLLNRDRLGEVVCSDVSSQATALAAQNLRLLTTTGLAMRARLLQQRATDFGKTGYIDAANAADRLASQLADGGGDLSARAGQANALDEDQLHQLFVSPPFPDLVITDVPYGRQTGWDDPSPSHPDQPIARLIRAVAPILSDDAVIAICAEARKITVPDVQPLERFRIGTRSVVIVRAADAQGAQS